VHRLGSDSYDDGCTIGAAFGSFVTEETKVQVWLHLPSGRLMSEGLPRSFCLGSNVVLLCADSLESLELLDAMKRECEEKAGPGVCFLLVLTKADLGVSDELRSAALRFGLPVIEVSAKTGDGCARLKQAMAEYGLRGMRKERRGRAAQLAVHAVREMFEGDRLFFAGVAVPRDVLEHCLLPALLDTSNDPAWDHVVGPDKELGSRPVRPATDGGIVSSLVGWINWGFGWAS
jgi:hypothetical protein